MLLVEWVWCKEIQNCQLGTRAKATGAGDPEDPFPRGGPKEGEEGRLFCQKKHKTYMKVYYTSVNFLWVYECLHLKYNNLISFIFLLWMLSVLEMVLVLAFPYYVK